jgi:hypothetical protein
MDIINIEDTKNKKEELNKLDNEIDSEFENMTIGPEILIHGKRIHKSLDCGQYDYWSAKDVCEQLEIEDVDRALAELDPEDKSEMYFRSTCTDPESSEPKKLVVVNVEGVWSLLLQSQAPIAKKFKRWVINQFLYTAFYSNENFIYDIDRSIVSEIEKLGLFPAGIQF